MVREQQLQNWARALSETEGEKCVSTLANIKKTIEEKFGNSVDIFLQGSYGNSTNIRQDSDVDIVVCYKDAYFSDTSRLSERDKNHHESLKTSDYSFARFKTDVEQLLKNKFLTAVRRKNKCIFISGNTYRVNADVVPCFVFKRFDSQYCIEAEGIQFVSDDSKRITSYPKQHYVNGVDKNKNTNKNFKAAVRVLKNIRNNLVDKGVMDEKLMSSFFLECLVWNLQNHVFKQSSYQELVNAVIENLWSDLNRLERSNNYAEVSDLMYLFRGQTARTPEDAKKFLSNIYYELNKS